MSALDPIDRRLVVATQEGLPMVERPFHVLAERLDLPPGEVIDRFRRLLESGAIRRIAAVPNHYRLGYAHNGMTVWAVAPEDVDRAGAMVGDLPNVTHCYRRPAHPPEWPYTLFAMVHGRTREDVDAQVAEIARLLGPLSSAHEVLYSTRILKKTGLRLSA